MTLPQRLTTWLEHRWVAPAYSGWLLMGLALFFFAAATNTLAGWLYVMSGVMGALLLIAAALPPRVLKGLQVHRQRIRPVSAGEGLLVEVEVHNATPRSKGLLQLRDEIDPQLGRMAEVAIATLSPQSTYHWRYEIPTHRRGLYRWKTFQVRTAAPLGLFWTSRRVTSPAMAIVYPTVLPLTSCSIVDALGDRTGRSWYRDDRPQSANEGLTRALRPYRWGDPIRLVHWRTSARYGELRVRELERTTSGEEILLCLDSQPAWTQDTFEQAVTATASLYFYALRHNFTVKIWTPERGIVWEPTAVLETLAAIQPQSPCRQALPSQPLIWIGMPEYLPPVLPAGSRWIVWSDGSMPVPVKGAGLVVHPHQPLTAQLQGGG